MVNLLQRGVASGLLASLFVQLGLSLRLEAINPYGSTTTTTAAQVKIAGSASESTTSTSDYSSIDLQNHQSFYWGGGDDSGYTLGNLTVSNTGENENVLGMEVFSDLLSNVTCTNSSMTVGFADSEAYSYAKNSWSWVNAVSNRTFIMVAGPSQCGWNEQRLPFLISAASFRDDISAARLTGNASTWEELLGEFEITVGPAPSDMVSTIAKRASGSKSATLSFDHSLSDKSIKLISEDGLELSVECKDCATKGSFDVEFKYKTKLELLKLKYEVETAELILTPKDVSVEINPALDLSGNLTKSYAKEYTLATIPLDGIDLVDVLVIDVQAVFAIGASAGPVNGDASVSMGISFDVSNSAQTTLDIENKKATSSGWSPTVSTTGFTLDAELDATLEAYLKGSLELDVSVLKYGYEAGLYLKPYIGADFSIEGSTSSVCSDKDKEYHYAIGVQPSAGLSLDADVAKASDQANPIADVTIASLTKSMSSTCFGFGSITSTKTTTSEKTSTTESKESTSTDKSTTEKKSSTESKTETSSTKTHPSSTSASATGHSSSHVHSSSKVAESSKAKTSASVTSSTYAHTTATKDSSSSHVTASSSAHSHNHARGYRHHGRI
ncbi:hypothetical protein BO71DRAFT_185441 [Aspergillus ellipticus CBS 707.79]|uniref:Uncharacterized protein n=1 Tax=Aspergillus ellipticus CBS 707.79 TaxID=1448320 RepID=A0A319E605_9EURO|nr:hypothetical protein BO71DRAFT_185441 [Aspergillus ellipticus CBS 707.79]